MEGRGSGFLREFLDRFRRSAGVPAQVTDEVAAELAPLYSALDAIDREAAAIRADAEQRASADRESVTDEVDRRLAAGREHAERERIRVVADARRAAEKAADEIVSAGVAEADRIRAQGRARVPVLVVDVVRCVVEGRT
jgi:hypothetical protein